MVRLLHPERCKSLLFDDWRLVDVCNAPLLDDFLKITASFFNFGPELNNGKSPLESIKAAINFVVKVVIIFSTPFVIICILTQFMVGGINFSLKSIHFKFEKMNPIKGLGKIFSVKGLVELAKSLLKVFF